MEREKGEERGERREERGERERGERGEGRGERGEGRRENIPESYHVSHAFRRLIEEESFSLIFLFFSFTCLFLLYFLIIFSYYIFLIYFLVRIKES